MLRVGGGNKWLQRMKRMVVCPWMWGFGAEAQLHADGCRGRPGRLIFFRQPHLSNIEVPRMLRAIFHVASEACIHVSAIFRSWTWVR
jgi:hypothetical protein